MQTCRVIGNVVATRKDEKMVGLKLLVCQPVDPVHLKPEGKPVVAADSVGAGEGELVLIVMGSSARQTPVTQNKPCDCAIMGIIDYIEIEGKRTFTKHKDDAR